MDTNNINDIDLNHYVTIADEQTEQIQQPLFDYPESYSTTLEETTQKTDFNYETDENDYSLNSNFVEQTNYEIKSQDETFIGQDDPQFKPINMPLIEKKVEAVVEEHRQINLSARMKVVLASFIIIVSSLLFVTVWNFVQAAKINDMMLQNQITITDLKVSIKELSDEYNVLGDEETIKEIAESSNFVQSDDTNTINISIDEMFQEIVIEDVPSNWFNDICNFITSLF